MKEFSSKLVVGSVVLRPERSPLLFMHVVVKGGYTEWHEFRDLETGRFKRISSPQIDWLAERSGWELLERSHPAIPSGSVGSEGSNPTKQAGCVREEDIVMKKPNLTSKKHSSRRAPRGVGMSDPMEPSEAPTMPAPAEKGAKAKKTRTVDYTRTDKRPHSFRYKRGSTFVTRSGAVALSKESDGALVIGPATDGAATDAAKLEAGTLELVSVKKRPNGKTAIAFKHPELGEVVAYDARAARAALRAS